MCLAIANFLCSALKREVLYIELADESQLLGVVGDKQVKISGHIGFLYRGVKYVLACDEDRAMQLLRNFSGFIIVDISKITEKTKVIFNQCDNRIVIGSMKPWCKKDMHLLLKKLEGGTDMKKLKYYNIGKINSERTNFKKEYHCNMASLPEIKNPFSIQEKEFSALLQMIE